MYKFKCVNCGEITHSSCNTVTPCENCGGQVVRSENDHPIFTGDLKGDLIILAKLIYEASQLHGGVYITANRVEDYSFADATARIDGQFISNRFEPHIPSINSCPFCGSVTAPRILSEADIVDDDTKECIEQYTVCCSARHDGCGASSGYSEYKDAAIAKWNRRGEA